MVLHHNLGPDLIFNSPDKLETYDFVIFFHYLKFLTKMVSHSHFEFLVFSYCFEFPEFSDNNKASNVIYLKTKSFVMKASLHYL